MSLNARNRAPANEDVFVKVKVPRAVKQHHHDTRQGGGVRHQSYVPPASARQTSTLSPSYRRLGVGAPTQGNKRNALVRTRTGDFTEHWTHRNTPTATSTPPANQRERTPKPGGTPTFQRSISESTPKERKAAVQSFRRYNSTLSEEREPTHYRRRTREREAKVAPAPVATEEENEFKALFQPWEAGQGEENVGDFTRSTDIEVYGECDEDEGEEKPDVISRIGNEHKAAMVKRYGTAKEQASRTIVTPSAKTLHRRQQNLLLSEKRENASPQHHSEFNQLLSTLRSITLQQAAQHEEEEERDDLTVIDLEEGEDTVSTANTRGAETRQFVGERGDKAGRDSPDGLGDSRMSRSLTQLLTQRPTQAAGGPNGKAVESTEGEERSGERGDTARPVGGRGGEEVEAVEDAGGVDTAACRESAQKIREQHAGLAVMLARYERTVFGVCKKNEEKKNLTELEVDSIVGG